MDRPRKTKAPSKRIAGPQHAAQVADVDCRPGILVALLLRATPQERAVYEQAFRGLDPQDGADDRISLVRLLLSPEDRNDPFPVRWERHTKTPILDELLTGHEWEQQRSDAYLAACTLSAGEHTPLPACQSPPLDLLTLRRAFPALLHSGGVANRVMTALLNASEPLSVNKLSGATRGEKAAGGARERTSSALSKLESNGLAVREGAGWKRGPATNRT
jgi:hypothetical protein